MLVKYTLRELEILWGCNSPLAQVNGMVETCNAKSYHNSTSDAMAQRHFLPVKTSMSALSHKHQRWALTSL